MSEDNYSKQSCDMVRVADDDAVHEGAPGSFFIDTLDNGQRVLWHKLPDGNAGAILLNPIVDTERNKGRPAWNWDGNEEKPTLTPSVHLPGRWHGWFRKGRMVSV